MDEFQRKFKDDAKKASKERQKELAILNGRATKERKQLLNRNADLERTINMNKEVAARAQLDLQTEVAGLNLTIKQYMDKEKVIIFILRYCILIANVNR
jgi:sulfite reductase alpha subunit-like flavoprotein